MIRHLLLPLPRLMVGDHIVRHTSPAISRNPTRKYPAEHCPNLGIQFQASGALQVERKWWRHMKNDRRLHAVGAGATSGERTENPSLLHRFSLGFAHQYQCGATLWKKLISIARAAQSIPSDFDATTQTDRRSACSIKIRHDKQKNVGKQSLLSPLA